MDNPDAKYLIKLNKREKETNKYFMLYFRIPSGYCMSPWPELESTMNIINVTEDYQDQDQSHKDLDFVRDHWRKPQAQWAQSIEVRRIIVYIKIILLITYYDLLNLNLN